MNVPNFMGYLKSKGSPVLYGPFGDLKFEYCNREFWRRGRYVDTVGKKKAEIQKYMQVTEMRMPDQICVCQGAASKRAL